MITDEQRDIIQRWEERCLSDDEGFTSRTLPGLALGAAIDRIRSLASPYAVPEKCVPDKLYFLFLDGRIEEAK